MSETPTPYISPLPGYIADAKRDAFLEGARWAMEVMRALAGGSPPPTPTEALCAARAYAGLPVE